jgi:hypothetical protein
MTAPNITFSGGTTINGGVTVHAAPRILQFHKEQVNDWIDPSILTQSGFIQPGAYGEPVILLELTQEQQDYINALPGLPTNYVLFEGNWGTGSTDHSPNTAFVLFPVSNGWQYSTILPLGSLAFSEYSVYTGTWNWPATALTLSDWG